MIIGKRFYFDAAHYLPHHKGKCKNLHGHTYTLDVEVEGEIDSGTNMVMDLHLLGDIVNQVVIKFDHGMLNDNWMHTPTCEGLISLLAQMINNLLPKEVKLYQLQLQEGKGGWARWAS
jgi:6-pyruvoyltetrahydropterin/6-carboxytetrahydropterin synthase